MWKFDDFSITQILRENNFGNSRSAKSTISNHSEALNFDFYEFLHCLKAEIYQSNEIHSKKIAKTAFIDLLNPPKFISRKI